MGPLDFICANVFLLLVSQFPYVSSSTFSGVYQPNTRPHNELYAASYLVPRKMFLQASLNFEEAIGNLEGSTFAVITARASKAVMTRDYFDMFVEHLSALTNLASSPPLVAELVKKMKVTLHHYTKIVQKLQTKQPLVDRPFQNNTIFILPFTMKAHIGKADAEVRKLFFQLTYYAAYLHFPNIAVATADEFHTEELEKLGLVARPFHVFKLYRPNEVPLGHMLMKDMLINTAKQMKENPQWAHFEYVYFSESDQILHMEHERDIYDFLKSNKDELFMVPHRMNTMQLPKEAPFALQKFTGDKWRAEVLEDAQLVVEATIRARGSCCDDGRWKFPDCGNWWYHCKDHGIRNASAWLKFGDSGFTFPLITEHRGRCKYYPTKVLCDMPDDCKHRVPTGGKTSMLCKEVAS